jgi:hypothetical protein
MAEKAVGGPQASDIFSLGGNYHAQNSDGDTTTSIVTAADDVGDVIATDTHGTMTSKTCNYVYNSTTPMWDGDSTNAAHKTLPRPGQFKGTFLITQVDVSYSATARPTLTVTGHNHAVNAHDTDGATYTPTIDIPGGFGCPGLFANTDTDGSSAPQSEAYSIMCEHVEADNGSGNHIAGANYGGKETYAPEYVGTPTLTVPSGWKRSSLKGTDANTEFDKTSMAYEKHIARDS